MQWSFLTCVSVSVLRFTIVIIAAVGVRRQRWRCGNLLRISVRQSKFKMPCDLVCLSQSSY